MPQHGSTDKSHSTLSAVSLGAISIVVAYYGSKYSSPSSSKHVSSSGIDLVAIVSIIYIISRAFKKTNRTLQEAAIEIMPLGVQLVSIYSTADLSAKGFCSEFRTRALIPKEQIIDVIVMELVWPHCVWSQVAFRVVKNTSGIRDMTRLSDSKKSDFQSYNIHKLLQEDRVAIIPCFPDECRGLLTHKQCLDVQVEIEKLLRIPAR